MSKAATAVQPEELILPSKCYIKKHDDPAFGDGSLLHPYGSVTKAVREKSGIPHVVFTLLSPVDEDIVIENQRDWYFGTRTTPGAAIRGVDVRGETTNLIFEALAITGTCITNTTGPTNSVFQNCQITGPFTCIVNDDDRIHLNDCTFLSEHPITIAGDGDGSIQFTACEWDSEKDSYVKVNAPHAFVTFRDCLDAAIWRAQGHVTIEGATYLVPSAQVNPNYAYVSEDTPGYNYFFSGSTIDYHKTVWPIRLEGTADYRFGTAFEFRADGSEIRGTFIAGGAVSLQMSDSDVRPGYEPRAAGNPAGRTVAVTLKDHLNGISDSLEMVQSIAAEDQSLEFTGGVDPGTGAVTGGWKYAPHWTFTDNILTLWTKDRSAKIFSANLGAALAGVQSVGVDDAKVYLLFYDQPNQQGTVIGQIPLSELSNFTGGPAIDVSQDGKITLLIDPNAGLAKTQGKGLGFAAGYSALTDALKTKLTDLPSVSQINTSFSGKVDKVTGQGLSQNSYTDAEKAKLGALPENSALQTALTAKADKKVPALAGNIAALDATGNLADSGIAGKIIPMSVTVDYEKATGGTITGEAWYVQATGEVTIRVTNTANFTNGNDTKAITFTKSWAKPPAKVWFSEKASGTTDNQHLYLGTDGAVYYQTTSTYIYAGAWTVSWNVNTAAKSGIIDVFKEYVAAIPALAAGNNGVSVSLPIPNTETIIGYTYEWLSGALTGAPAGVFSIGTSEVKWQNICNLTVAANTLRLRVKTVAGASAIQTIITAIPALTAGQIKEDSITQSKPYSGARLLGSWLKFNATNWWVPSYVVKESTTDVKVSFIGNSAGALAAGALSFVGVYL